MILDIPGIPEDLFEKIDQFRGSKSREEYVLSVLQSSVLSSTPRIYP
jgi:hypothetical protein